MFLLERNEMVHDDKGQSSKASTIHFPDPKTHLQSI